MRTLAIDYGAKRIGLALSDEGGRFATPLEVLQVSDPSRAVAPILKLITEEAVQRVVVGLPLNMDDTLGPSARAAIAFGRQISTQSGVAVVFVDERLSSFAAEQRFNERSRAGGKMTRGQKKQRLDAHAAAGFLQEYLDGKLGAIAVE